MKSTLEISDRWGRPWRHLNVIPDLLTAINKGDCCRDRLPALAGEYQTSQQRGDTAPGREARVLKWHFMPVLCCLVDWGYGLGDGACNVAEPAEVGSIL